MERKSAVLFENCPYEEGGDSGTIGPGPTKTKPPAVVMQEGKEEVKGEMVSKEALISVQDQLNDLVAGFQYFGVTYKYAQDIYTETTLTIHQEKAKCKKAYQDNTFLQKSVNGMLNIIMGDDPHVQSSNQILMGYTRRWMYFSNYLMEMRNGIKQALISGDGYVRKIRGNKGSFKYLNIENSEDMYIDWNYKENRPDRYIQRVYYTEANAKDIKSPEYKTFTLTTPLGTETINGIEYSADEIIHIKFLENVWGVYGRSPVASALDDVDILNQMERSSAVIARYKAVPKKMIFPDSNKDDEVMDDKAVEKVKDVLKKMKDFESPVVGTKFGSLNLTDGGQALDLTPYFDYFKRKISIVMSPEFIVHGELVNRSTSIEQKQMFFLDVCSIRSGFEPIIQESLNEGLIASMKVLEDQDIKVPKAHFYFQWGEYDVELREGKIIRIQKEWNDGMIKLDEYREQMNYDLDETFGTAYKWELTSSPEAELGEKLKSLVGGENGNTKKD